MSVLYLNGWKVSAQLRDRRIVATNSETGESAQTALFNLERIVCVGYPKVSMPLLHSLLKSGIPVVFLTANGQWLNTLTPPGNGNAIRRLRQYESHKDASFALGIAKSLIDAKIHNMRRMLQRWSANRRQTACDEQKLASRTLAECRRKLVKANALEEVMGFEGAATARYFARLASFFPEDLPFGGRSRRPPRNPANAILSWTYAIVLSEIDTTLRVADLDPCIGYLHSLSTGRPALALDLLEPFRAPLCDALALKLLTHRLLTKEHFDFQKDSGGYFLNQEGKRIFFREYERTMERVFLEKESNEPTTFRKLIRKLPYDFCRALGEEQRGRRRASRLSFCKYDFCRALGEEQQLKPFLVT